MNGKGMEATLFGDAEQQNGPQIGWMGAGEFGHARRWKERG